MDTSLANFFNLFWSDKEVRSLFLLHKELLLEKNSIEIGIVDYYLQRFVISNSILAKKDVEAEIGFRQEIKSNAVIMNIAASKDKYLNKDKMDTFFKKHFGRAAHIVKKETEDDERGMFPLVHGALDRIEGENGSINLEGVSGLLSDYKIAPEGVENIDELGIHAEETIEGEVKSIFSNVNFTDVFIAVDNFSKLYNNIIQKTSLINAHSQAADVLYNKKNYNRRIEVFKKLYQLELIKGGKFKSYFECTNCNKDVFNGFINLDISPDKIKIKCPNCRKNTHYLVPYFIENSLFEHLYQPDGVLFSALAFLLQINKIKFQANCNIENSNEIDFITYKEKQIDRILEVKMFRNDKSDEVKIKAISGAIAKMKKTKEQLISHKADFINVPSFLIINFSNASLLKRARRNLKNDLDKFNIRILSPMNFRELLEEEG